MFVGLFLLGSVITAIVDGLIGVSFKEVGSLIAITHKVTYMVWGGILMGLIKWSEKSG